MYLSKIEFHNFRNLEKVQINCDRKLNLFLGENGQGKSNLLEGISLALRGQSFRQANVSDFIRFDHSKARIQAELIKQDLDHKLKIEVVSGKKSILWNSKSSNSNQLRKNFSCILFSPESLNAIKLGPEVRRSLVDDLLVHTDFNKIDLIRKFQKLRRSRNRILKDHKDGRISKSDGMDLLKSLDQIYIGVSADLTYCRKDALNSLQPLMQEAMQFLFDENVEIAVDYVVSGHSALDWDREKMVDAHRQRRLELLSSELSSGSTLVGPHKHDIQFKMNGHDGRYYCSQGQQRALILAFKMAQILYHRRIHKESLILLLDDVLSELDAVRQGRLLEFLSGLDSQIFLTTTDANLPASLSQADYSVCTLQAGQVT